MLAPVQNDNWRKGVIMREALSVIIRETLNVIRSECEGSVTVVGKTVKSHQSDRFITQGHVTIIHEVEFMICAIWHDVLSMYFT